MARLSKLSKKSKKSKVNKVARKTKKVKKDIEVKKCKDIIHQNARVKELQNNPEILKILEEIKETAINVVGDDVIELAEKLADVEQLEKVIRSNQMPEQIMFRLPCVKKPLIGTPKQVQEELDKLALKIQKHPKDYASFDKIHLYLHGYLINVVLKKFPFIRGFQTADIYQETLIALKFKAIPGFKMEKGMSFLNFAKMCIRRHLITMLNTSKTRIKDQAINQAISLDNSPSKEDDDEGKSTYANIIADTKAPVDKAIETNEAYEVSKDFLFSALSEFEKMVLSEHLAGMSYREISKSISKALKGRYNAKSVDNALHRIRKKAVYLIKHSKKEDLPIFIYKYLN